MAPLFCQTDTVISGKHYKMIDDSNTSIVKGKKKSNPVDSVFIINNKKFRFYNNWFTIGGGVQQNLTFKSSLGFAGEADFNFHIQKHYFQTGIILTGERFGFYTNYALHAGYGKHYEDRDVLFSGFAGLTYSTGYTKVGDTVYTHHYNVPGLYVQGDIIKKITYDVGFGASLFVDWNQVQSMAGLRFILYFSGSYKGKKYEHYGGN